MSNAESKTSSKTFIFFQRSTSNKLKTFFDLDDHSVDARYKSHYSTSRSLNTPALTHSNTHVALTESSLDFTGAINVDEQLKVQGCSNIYAVGGATNLKSRKHFENSKLQADVVASNIKASLNQEVFRTFKPASCPTLVTIGRYGGVGYEDGSLLDEDKVMERKSEDVFIKRVWKDFGLVFPGAMNPAYDADSTSTSVTSS